MNYEDSAINDVDVPVASLRMFQHLVKTYASEVNKLNSVWQEFSDEDVAFKSHPRSSISEIIHSVTPQGRGTFTSRNYGRKVQIARK